MTIKGLNYSSILTNKMKVLETVCNRMEKFNFNKETRIDSTGSSESTGLDSRSMTSFNKGYETLNSTSLEVRPFAPTTEQRQNYLVEQAYYLNALYGNQQTSPTPQEKMVNLISTSFDLNSAIMSYCW